MVNFGLAVLTKGGGMRESMKIVVHTGRTYFGEPCMAFIFWRFTFLFMFAQVNWFALPEYTIIGGWRGAAKWHRLANLRLNISANKGNWSFSHFVFLDV